MNDYMSVILCELLYLSTRMEVSQQPAISHGWDPLVTTTGIPDLVSEPVAHGEQLAEERPC